MYDRCLLENNLSTSLIKLNEALGYKDLASYASNLSHGLLTLRSETPSTPLEFVENKITTMTDKVLPTVMDNDNNFQQNFNFNNRRNNFQRWNNNNQKWNNNQRGNNFNRRGGFNNWRGNNRRGRF